MKNIKVFALSVVLAFAFATGALASPRVGDIMRFGEWDWRVLDVQNNRALIITENIIERRAYNEEDEEVTWETCTLRGYLNGEFLQKFSGEERGRIAETRIQNPDNLWYARKGGNHTEDKVFLLSLEEVDRYFGNSGDYENRRSKSERFFDGKREFVPDEDGPALVFSNANDSDRTAKLNNEPCLWWLRSPGYYSSRAAIVGGGGFVDASGVLVIDDYSGLRPALWLNL